MRTIKFRGIDIETREWVYGFYVKESSPYFTEPAHYIEFKGLKDRVVHKSVGQFTGLKDKNGKEIYEGDIVKYIIQVGKEGNDIGTIKWFNLITAFRILNKCGRGTAGIDQTLEVIGNIYENPELLESERCLKKNFQV